MNLSASLIEFWISLESVFVTLSDERLNRYRANEAVSWYSLFLHALRVSRRQYMMTALLVQNGKSLIGNGGGHITVRDRPSLEAFAGDACGPPEDYVRLVGPL